MLKRSVVVTFLVSAVLTLVLIETVLEKPYVLTKSFFRNSLQTSGEGNRNKENFLSNCVLPTVTDVMPGSTVIIGHAYGSPNGSGYFITEAVEEFILTHSSSLDAVIFSGDVFKVPSTARWARLEALSQKSGVKFHVAPGNHDVGFGDNPARDVWNVSGYRLPKTGVQHLLLSGFNVLLEDSVVTNWQVSPTVLQALNGSFSDDPVVLVRHHIAVSEMVEVANSQAGFPGELPELMDLSSKVLNQTTIVSGDTGAFPHLPRVSCLTDNKLTSIANGIGSVQGDAVLMLNDGNIAQFPL